MVMLASIILGLLGFLLVLFLVISGPAALIWLFSMRKQIAELFEQNAKLESSLRRIQHDLPAHRPDMSKSGVITIETEKPAEQPAQPVRPAAPVVHFAVPATTSVTQPPSHSASTPYDSGLRFRTGNDSSILRTTADWSSISNKKTLQKETKVPREPATMPPHPFWKLFVGQKLFGWIAVVGLIATATLLFQYGHYVFNTLGSIVINLIFTGEAARYLYEAAGIWESYSVHCTLSAFQQGFWFSSTLSILWLLFGGAAFAIGCLWRSPILCWMAILLFTVTLGKIVIVDMSGVNELYRFGAVVALAILLALAAWAYQRFKPER